MWFRDRLVYEDLLERGSFWRWNEACRLSNVVDVNVRELADPCNVGVFKDVVVYLAAFAKLSVVHRYVVAEATAVFVEREIR